MQVTYSSDYFQELHDLAVKLIKSGNAFVCHQTAEEISEYRFGSFLAGADNEDPQRALSPKSLFEFIDLQNTWQRLGCNVNSVLSSGVPSAKE